MKITIETPARLHFGVLNPVINTVRKYGGVGIAIKKPAYEITIKENNKTKITGPQKERAKKITQKLNKIHNLPTKAEIKINKTIPTHVGLGSTTQLTLALAKGLTLLNNKEIPTTTLAKQMDRGKRSGIGTYAFIHGGFIVDGGGEKEFPPLTIRHNFPKKWPLIIATPNITRGPREKGEEKYFQKLETQTNTVGKICTTLILKMIPALKNQDNKTFGQSLTELDELVGKIFSTKQGGIHRGEPVTQTINYILNQEATGAGQSSWGPAVYGLVEGFDQARELGGKVEGFLRDRGWLGDVMVVEPDNEGVKIRVQE